MDAIQTSPARQLKTIFEGYPRHLLPASAFEHLTRYYLDIDALGRLDTDTGDPLLDELTLTAMLREYVPREIADRLVGALAEIPGAAFRPAARQGPPVREIPWFELARDVTVYDTRPAATFGDLKLPGPASVSKVVSAVHACFPSLEPELLTPDVLPRRVQALVESDDMATRVMPVIARQLGWWAAAVALLLIPPALVARSPAGTRLEPDIGNAWPLSMFFLAAAVGGWTLTVVGSCVLAPVEQ